MYQWGFSSNHQQIQDEFDSYGGLIKVDYQKKMQNDPNQPLRGYKDDYPYKNQKKKGNKKHGNDKRYQQQNQIYEQRPTNNPRDQQFDKEQYEGKNQQMGSEIYEYKYQNNSNNDNLQNSDYGPYQNYPPNKSIINSQIQQQQQPQQQQLLQQFNLQQPQISSQPMYQNQFRQSQQQQQSEQQYSSNIMQQVQSQRIQYQDEQQMNNKEQYQNESGFIEVKMNQNQQQQKNNQQINSSHQIPKSIITQLKKEEQTENLYKPYHTLIDKFFQFADIEIKITNIDPIVEPYLSEIYFELQQLKLKIQKEDLEDYYLQNRTYQVKEQLENNISQLDKMIILHSLFIENLYREAENYKSKILINYQKYQYKINPLDQKFEGLAKKFYYIFQKTWDNQIILIEQCKTDFEADSKIKLLKAPRINQSFCKELGLQKPIIILASELNLKAMQETQILYNGGLLFQQKSNEILVINLFDQNQNENISILQQKLQNFLQDPQYIKNVKESFDIDCQPQKDINEIDKCIQALQTQESIEITVTTPVFNISNKGKYLVQAELQLWIEGYQTENIINQKLKIVKQKLNEIYNPPVIIKVRNKEQINLWNKFLGSLFENQNNSKECITKEDKDVLTIELNGNQDVIYEKKEKIETLLKQFQCKTIKHQCDTDMFPVLQSKQAQLSKLFNVIFTEIASEFGQCQIQMIDLDQNHEMVIVEAYFNAEEFMFTNISGKIIEFLNNIDYLAQKINFKEFLQFQGLKEIQFQDQYQVAVTQNKERGTEFVGRKENLEEIKQMVKQFEQSKKENQTSIIIDCDNKLIFNKIKQLNSQPLKQGNIEEENVVVISFPQENKIMLQASKKQIQSEKDKILKKIQQLQNEIKIKPCQFSEKEVKFVDKHFKQLVEKLQKNNEVIISTSSQTQTLSQSEKSAACTLEYQNKKIQIIYGDISTIQCDAIVNSCNNKMSFGDSLQLTGVAQSIFQLGGTQYSSYCQDYIRRYQQLETGDVFTYKMPNDRQIKYILNVATPIYSQGFVTEDDLIEIQANIEAIFKEVKNLDISTLTLPIFGGGACGYSYNQVAQVVLNTAINQLYFQQNQIETIYIVELIDIKVDWLTRILKSILQPPNKERQIKYQWQWQDSQDFKDYDDEDINKQIDEAYEQFQQTNKDQMIQLKFPYSKQPGTHSVDLDKQTVTDIALKTTKKIVSKSISNSKRFYFDEDIVDDQLNEYMILQEMNKINKFDIFFKRHLVEFKKGEMYQMNQDTQYKRIIKPIKYQPRKSKTQVKSNKLVGKQFNLIETQNKLFSKLVQQKSNYDQLTLQSFDGSLNEMIYKQIKSELDKSILEYKFDVPNIPDAALKELQQFISQIALSINGKFKQGEKIILKIFEKKKNKIVNYINSLKTSERSYPDYWIPQNQNLEKVALRSDSAEYQKIYNLFKQTENGNIFEIYRIQNKSLWDNYIAEKNKLIEINKQQGRILTPLETQRYLWHGVKQSHPQIIYSGLKEAFDQTYSNVGMWGAGIYFAENASYSRNYSYQLQLKDGQKNIGKLVFLCCLVTTGKVEVRAADTAIKRPSQGFDCVSGNTNGSDVYILYSMDIRRAYPAYEIIYT